MLLCTTEVLVCTTRYHSSSTSSYYTVLRQYLFVRQNATPVLLCASRWYASITPYYKVPRQYYKVLPRTTTLYNKVHYSGITLNNKVLRQYYLYYQVLLQYHPVLQSTTPVPLRTTPVSRCTFDFAPACLSAARLGRRVWNQHYCAIIEKSKCKIRSNSVATDRCPEPSTSNFQGIATGQNVVMVNPKS